MTKETIQIVITEQGSRVVQRNLENIGSSAKSASGYVSNLKSNLTITGSTQIGIKSANSAVSSLSNSLSSLGLTTVPLSNLKSSLSSIGSSQSAVQGTSAAITGLTATLTGLNTATNTTLNLKNSLNSVGTTQNGVKGTSTAVSGLTTNINNLNSSITPLNRNLISLNKAQAGVKSTSSAISGLVSNFNNFGVSANNTVKNIATSVDSLRVAATTIGFGAITSQLVALADTYTIIQNRLKTVTGSELELAAVENELFQVSNRTRQGYRQTTELFARLALSSKELGVSQRELIEFTETLGQAIGLSGATAEEAGNALIQLSQGIAAGALRGDELRSVLEQLPVVADVIAKGFGVTRGKLRELGVEGKLTADGILKAFAAARKEIGENFAKSVPTIGQSFQVLKNNLLQLVGSFATTSGASAFISSAINTLAQNLEVVARGVVSLATVITTVFVGKALKALFVALASNPVGALLTLFAGLLTATAAYADQITISSDRIATLQDLALAAWEAIAFGFSELVDFFSRNFGFILDLGKEIFGDLEFSIGGLLIAAARITDGISGVFIGSFNAIKAAFSGLPQALFDVFKNSLNGVIKLVEDTVNKIITAINAVSSVAAIPEIGKLDLGRIGVDANNGFNRLGKEIGASFKEGLATSTSENAVNSLFDRADKIASERIAKEEKRRKELEGARLELTRRGNKTFIAPEDTNRKKTFADILSDLKKEGELLKLNAKEREVYSLVLRAEQTLRRDLSKAEKELLLNQARLNQAKEDELANDKFLKNLETETELLSLNIREREKYQNTLKLEEQLKRKLTEAEKIALDTKLQELQIAKDKDTINRTIQELLIENELLSTNTSIRAQRAKILEVEKQLGRVLTSDEQTQIANLVSQNEEIQRQNQLLQELVSPRETLLQKQQDLNDLYKQGKLTVDQYGAAMRSLNEELTATNNTLLGGIENGIARLSKQMDNFGSLVSDAVVSAFDKASEAIVDFAKTGELNVRQLFGTLFEQLLKLSSQQVFANLTNSLLGGFGGGGFGGGGGPMMMGFGGAESSRYSLTIQLRVTNVFNRVNFGNFSGTLGSAFFGIPSSASAARAMDLNLRFNF